MGILQLADGFQRAVPRSADEVMSIPSLLKDFWKYVKDYRTLPGWAAKAAVAGPIITFVTRLGPPGMFIGGLALLTALVEISVLMLTYQLFALRANKSQESPIARQSMIDRIERTWIYQLVGMSAIIVFYVTMFTLFTYWDPYDYQRQAKGLWKQHALRESLERSTPQHVQELDLGADFNESTSDKTLLEWAGYDPTKIWDETSIRIVECILIITWIAFFGAMAGYVSTFIALRRHELALVVEEGVRKNAGVRRVKTNGKTRRTRKGGKDTDGDQSASTTTSS